MTHGSCFDLLDLVGVNDKAFGYIDPPYAPESMALEAHYGDRSWTLDDHERLVDKLLVTSMKVALSGYDNECYNRPCSSWLAEADRFFW
ncbi:DNA adenine methylase [Brevibacillus reuszeri]|uniref:DNA adenine methylase n=1 Tax=Brevibacillus reuszeri TaxID=54915 RepID=UPI003D20A8F6